MNLPYWSDSFLVTTRLVAHIILTVIFINQKLDEWIEIRETPYIR